MMEEYMYFDQLFEKLSLTEQRISDREFDGCTFRNCEFSGVTFSECTFVDCRFEDCNLSMAKFPASGIKNVYFSNSKLLGIRFDECADFLFHVECVNSNCDYAWFSGKKMQKSKFTGCSLKGVNFTGADLTGSDFSGSDLQDSVFDNTQLKDADFSGARHYRIDPLLNPMRKARFSADGLHGLLDKYDIKIV